LAAGRLPRSLLGLALLGTVAFLALHQVFRHAPGAAEGAPGVLVWWSALSAVAVVNVVGWVLAARAFQRARPMMPPHQAAQRRWQLPLCGLYVAGCALRSFFPKADVQRICLFDSFLSSVLVGRSIATVAEVAFVAQWALLLSEFARETESRLALFTARLALPFIFFAETCSWYAVLTTSYIGNVLEQSTWALTVCLIIVGTVSVWRRADPRHHRFLMVTLVMGVAYVIFMATVDVPMYVGRLLADRAAGRHYLTLADGVVDLARRWIVTFSWDDWHTEIPWMSLYFSVEVWFSIAFIHAPRITARVATTSPTVPTPASAAQRR
jgi:hypothetical protein